MAAKPTVPPVEVGKPKNPPPSPLPDTTRKPIRPPNQTDPTSNI